MVLFALFIAAQMAVQPGTIDQLAQAKSLAERDMLPAAEIAAREYVASHPDLAAGHYQLGYILFRETKARESLAEYTVGAKYQRPSATDLRVVGADYVLLSDYGDADKWFTKSTEWDPNNVLGWYYLGRTKYNENRFEEAIDAFQKCLQLSPKHVKAEDNLGLSLQGLGRNEEAQAAFLKAIEWQSTETAKNPWPYIDFGSFLLENNRPEKAIPYLQNAIELTPDSAKAHQQLGKAYLALRKLDKAQAELEESVKLEPDNSRAHYVLGQLYEKEGLRDKAKKEFARYAELSKTHPADKDSLQ